MSIGYNTQHGHIHALQLRVAFGDFPTGTGATKVIPMGAIPAGSVYLRSYLQVVTAFSGAGFSPMIRVGITGIGTGTGTINYGWFLSTADINWTTTAGLFDGSTGSTVAITHRGLLTSDCKVGASLDNLTAQPTAGEATIVVEYMPPVMNKEATTTFDT